MCGVEALQRPKLDEGNDSGGSARSQRRVARCPKQDDCCLEEPGLAVLKHALDYVSRLVSFVAHGQAVAWCRKVAISPEVLVKRSDARPNHTVGGGQDGLRVER